ncbi:MAG: cell wall hydrolase [Rhodobacteraceae bacterium]|nr:MAG: cell wall hydrolase [Paracoccaceae bacterium]
MGKLPRFWTLFRFSAITTWFLGWNKVKGTGARVRALQDFMGETARSLAAMPSAIKSFVLVRSGPTRRSIAAEIKARSGRGRKGLTVSALCAMMVLIAVPSVGSRLEDATLNSEMRARLVMASVQHSNPLARNTVVTETPQLAPVRVASLDYDHTAALRSALTMVSVQQADDAVIRPAPRREMQLAEPLQRSLRPVARPENVVSSQQMRLSTSGNVVAPVALDLGLAPKHVTRPKLRPASIERRAVRYSRNWLRSVEPRELNAQDACLATAIYHEARGEGIRGQFAVAEVVLNRVDSGQFPNTICGVVYQGVREGRVGGCQFSFACDGRSEAMPNRSAARIARRIAQVMADGGHRGLTNGALYFHTTAVSPSWSLRFTQTAQIGAHLFYRG